MRTLRLLVIWTFASLVAGTLFYAVMTGTQVYFIGVRGRKAFDLGLSWSIATYGAFHWALLSVVTLPLFLLPIVSWIGASRLSSRFDARQHLVASATLFAMLGAIVRVAALEAPPFWDSPLASLARYFSSAWGLTEVLTLWAGLLLPRLVLASLRPGAFLRRPTTEARR